MDFMMNFLETLGTIAFAVSGAIEAMKKQMDLLGVIVLGMVTAIGGGVIRDIVTGEIPPIAFQNPTQAKVAIVVSIVVFFLAMFLTRHDILTNVSWANAVLFISDAMGLAAFTILGFVVYGYSMICIGFGQGISPLVSICRGAHEMEVAAENMVILRLILLRHLKNIWHSLRLLFERQANNW